MKTEHLIGIAGLLGIAWYLSKGKKPAQKKVVKQVLPAPLPPVPEGVFAPSAAAAAPVPPPEVQAAPTTEPAPSAPPSAPATVVPKQLATEVDVAQVAQIAKDYLAAKGISGAVRHVYSAQQGGHLYKMRAGGMLYTVLVKPDGTTTEPEAPVPFSAEMRAELEQGAAMIATVYAIEKGRFTVAQAMAAGITEEKPPRVTARNGDFLVEYVKPDGSIFDAFIVPGDPDVIALKGMDAIVPVGVAPADLKGPFGFTDWD